MLARRSGRADAKTDGFYIVDEYIKIQKGTYKKEPIGSSISLFNNSNLELLKRENNEKTRPCIMGIF